jgi:hypothetical protein
MPAENQTEKSRYPSKYSNGTFITAGQFITEMICEKKASIQRKQIGQHFWKLPEWASFYRQQILAANGLLKIYSEKAIIAALQSKPAYRIFSLRAPHLDAIIEAEQRKIDLVNQQRVKQATEIKEVKPELRKSVVKKTLADRLRELDE